MNLEYCPRCKKLFAKGFHNMCQNCIREIDKEYDLCSTYLKENRRCNINELSDATGVSVRQISKFIREGRISIAHLPNIHYPCESCGEPIREHTMCFNCRAKLAKEVGAATEEKKLPEQQSSNPPAGAYRITKRDQ